MKLLFVVNPISGGVDKEPFLKTALELCEKYGIDSHIFKTSGKNDPDKLQKVLTDFSPDRVASVGGDGTTLFTSIALLHTDIPFGIIPLGSANGMAVELSVNLNPIEAFKDLLMSELIGHLDLISVNNDHYSIHIGDVGMNAELVQSYEKDPKRGMVTYAKYFFEELKKNKPFPFEIEANGEIKNYKGVMLGICNSRKYGTGVPINLKGNPMDGKFELVVIKNIDTSSLIKAGLSKFDESFQDEKDATVVSTEKAMVTFDKPRLLQLDGEVIGKFKTLNIEVIKQAVKFITTSDNIYLK